MTMQDVVHQLFADSVWEEFSLLSKNVDEQSITDILRRLDLLDYKEKHGSLRRYSPAHECIKAQRVPCGRNFTRGRFPDNGRRTLFAFDGYWPGSG